MDRLNGLNRKDPLDELASEYAVVMHALAKALGAARNWYQVVSIARVMTEVEVCRYLPMRRELERLSSDTAGSIAGFEQGPPVQEEAATPSPGAGTKGGT